MIDPRYTPTISAISARIKHVAPLPRRVRVMPDLDRGKRLPADQVWVDDVHVGEWPGFPNFYPGEQLRLLAEFLGTYIHPDSSWGYPEVLMELKDGTTFYLTFELDSPCDIGLRDGTRPVVGTYRYFEYHPTVRWCGSGKFTQGQIRYRQQLAKRLKG